MSVFARPPKKSPGRWVLLVAAALGACGDRAVPPAASSAAASGSAARAEPGPAASSSPRRVDPRWRSALDGDAARAAELASDVAVPELEAALADEDAVRAAALRALPFAGDRDATLGALATALDHGRGDEGAVADAIDRTLATSRRDTEVMSREGAKACSAALARVAASGGRGTLEASRAESLSRRVAE